MARIHLNWSGCRDWLEARAKIAPLRNGATLYGNFADIAGNAAEIRAKLEGAGFLVHDEIPGRFEDARFSLYRGEA